jgi:hypothetical protein
MRTLVGKLPMLVIKCKSLACIFLALDFDGMRLVINQKPFATGRMQSKPYRMPWGMCLLAKTP